MNRTATKVALGVVVSVVGALALAPAAAASRPNDTVLTIYSTAQNAVGDQRVLGTIGHGTTDLPGQSVTVKYFKFHTGSWTRLGVKHPTLDENSGFKTKFTSVPKHGTCKVAAAYAGDAYNSASKHHVLIKCATGRPA